MQTYTLIIDHSKFTIFGPDFALTIRLLNIKILSVVLLQQSYLQNIVCIISQYHEIIKLIRKWNAEINNMKFEYIHIRLIWYLIHFHLYIYIMEFSTTVIISF